MRDFDACFLCLQTARDPVCCVEGHLSCKECIYENILSQKLEIERQTKLLALQEAQAQKEQEQKEELAQQIILNEFEKSHMGVLSKTESVRGKLVAVADGGSPSTQNGAKSSSKCVYKVAEFGPHPSLLIFFFFICQIDDKKRAFELDPEELERRSKQERIDVAKAVEEAV